MKAKSLFSAVLRPLKQGAAPPPPTATTAAAGGAEHPAPPPPPSMMALNCDVQLWRRLQESLFYQSNFEARPSIIAELERRISGGADPDTLPRGPASTARAHELVKNLIHEFNEGYSDVSGGEKLAIVANLTAAYDDLRRLPLLITTYAAEKKVNMQEALDFVQDVKAEVKAARKRAEWLYSSTAIGKRWQDALSIHSSSFRQCMHGLTVDFSTQAKVDSMIWSADETFSFTDYKTPDPGQDANACMELRALASCGVLYIGQQAAEDLNKICGLFRKPRDPDSLSKVFRQRRQLHLESLALVQRVKAAFQVIGQEPSRATRYLVTTGLDAAKHILEGEPYTATACALYTALSTAIHQGTGLVADAAHTEAVTARKEAKAAGDAAQGLWRQLQQTQQQQKDLEVKVDILTQELIMRTSNKRGREAEGASAGGDEPGAKRTPSTANRFRGAQAAMVAAAPGGSPSPTRFPLASHPLVNIATAGVPSHPLPICIGDTGAAAPSGSAAIAGSPLMGQPLKISFRANLAAAAGQASPAVAAAVAAAGRLAAAGTGQAQLGIHISDQTIDCKLP